MSVSEQMSTRFTLLARSSRISQVVNAANADEIHSYVVVQDGAALMATHWRTLKERIAALADQFGEAALKMSLADIHEGWSPQPPRAPDEDEDEALSRLQPGEIVPVVEGDQVVGVLAKSTRAIGSSDLASLYGPRYVVFADQKPAPTLPTRTCTHCGKVIDFYRPKRVGDTLERHCPHCDFLIPIGQP